MVDREERLMDMFRDEGATQQADMIRDDAADRSQEAWPAIQASSLKEMSTTACTPAKQIYFDLLLDDLDDSRLLRSRRYLSEQLEMAARKQTDLPSDPWAVPAWAAANATRVGVQYRAYLDERATGAPRRYFSTKSHALYFLKGVAPTKLVDGAWLYGLLSHWRDSRFSALISIYLEELGEGVSDKNHVVIYKNLLAAHGCDQWRTLSDTYFEQGAIQLALARHSANFLPELVGYNLGYEQLPLHLPICAYELNELGINPYYFTLHVTVDNAVSGHGDKALKGLFDSLPQVAGSKDFYRRVINGYKLNMLGASTHSVIDEFDLYKELLAILTAKCGAGAQLHSDYCRISGKSVNEWLSDPGQLPEFLDSLQRLGWIKRHQNPELSRFWTLIQGEGAQMFGVFNAYEKQVIHDWIAGDSVRANEPRRLSYIAKERLFGTPEQDRGAARKNDMASRRGGLEISRAPDDAAQRDDFNADLFLLEERLMSLSDKDAAMAMLIKLLSPAQHHTSLGLTATRYFTRLRDNVGG